MKKIFLIITLHTLVHATPESKKHHSGYMHEFGCFERRVTAYLQENKIKKSHFQLLERTLNQLLMRVEKRGCEKLFAKEINRIKQMLTKLASQQTWPISKTNDNLDNPERR